MTDEDSLTRRSVLGKFTMLFAAILGITTGAASARSDDLPAAPQQSETAAEKTMASKTKTLAEKPRNGIHTGTIDRIVDGEHVVILLESDGETVGQYVVDHDRVPDGEEGDSVTVWLFRGTVVGVWVD
ncbi:hypothetical protein [Halovenus amylolytica]|uniref:hypothetical protein n=1 Tax=Halovenus amylolytica TaxID=2500550 RepID=UPI002FC4FBC4